MTRIPSAWEFLLTSMYSVIFSLSYSASSQLLCEPGFLQDVNAIEQCTQMTCTRRVAWVKDRIYSFKPLRLWDHFLSQPGVACPGAGHHLVTSLVAQWLGLDSLLPMLGAQVRSLFRELDPTCCNWRPHTRQWRSQRLCATTNTQHSQIKKKKRQHLAREGFCSLLLLSQTLVNVCT